MRTIASVLTLRRHGTIRLNGVTATNKSGVSAAYGPPDFARGQILILQVLDLLAIRVLPCNHDCRASTSTLLSSLLKPSQHIFPTCHHDEDNRKKVCRLPGESDRVFPSGWPDGRQISSRAAETLEYRKVLLVTLAWQKTQRDVCPCAE